MTYDGVLRSVEAHLVGTLGPCSGRAGVSFLGSEQIEVLRFSAEGVVRYVTLGMSRYPMADPGSELVAQHGPRAELVLTVRGAQDSVLRRLAVLASSPVVEGVVVSAGAGLDVAEPLWDGARFTAVLVGQPGGLVADLPVEGDEPVRFLPVLPMTPNEAAWKRVHGAAALEERWLAQGLDLRDPFRPEADLG
ncbi:MAG TPA: suppressor of fused domain protein [Mycobacteriales bacterium]|nr:suppressor of fused domain protein [Mycobacteriales bacterium]